MVRPISSIHNRRSMSDPLIRALDDYVVLEPGKPEQLLSAADTLTWLSGWLRSLDQLPADLADQPDVEAAAQRLIDTACDLEISPGVTLQWFAVRLEPPNGLSSVGSALGRILQQAWQQLQNPIGNRVRGFVVDHHREIGFGVEGTVAPFSSAFRVGFRVGGLQYSGRTVLSVLRRCINWSGTTSSQITMPLCSTPQFSGWVTTPPPVATTSEWR